MKTFPRFAYSLSNESDGPQRPDVLKPTAWYKASQDSLDSSKEQTAITSGSSLGNFVDDFALVEYAKQAFQREAAQIPGVISVVKTRTSKTREEQLCVIVADLFSTVTHDVIRLHEQIDDAFPGVRFDVDIKDVNTIDLTFS